MHCPYRQTLRTRVTAEPYYREGAVQNALNLFEGRALSLRKSPVDTAGTSGPLRMPLGLYLYLCRLGDADVGGSTLRWWWSLLS